MLFLPLILTIASIDINEITKNQDNNEKENEQYRSAES